MSGNREAMAKMSKDDLLKIIAATLTGMSVDEFQAEVKKWLVRGQRRALEEALYGTHLSADAGSSEVPARQRLQDVHRDGRRHRLRPPVFGSDVRHTARAGRRQRGGCEIRLREGRQTVPDQGARIVAQR